MFKCALKLVRNTELITTLTDFTLYFQGKLESNNDRAKNEFRFSQFYLHLFSV